MSFGCLSLHRFCYPQPNHFHPSSYYTLLSTGISPLVGSPCEFIPSLFLHFDFSGALRKRDQLRHVISLRSESVLFKK